MDLVLASCNPNKIREFQELLGSEFHIFDLSSFANAKIAEETGSTFAENAILKAVSLSENRRFFVIADDSGLEVDALGGAPGIYSARYAGEKATDSENINKLVRELRSQNIVDEKRSARFRCVIALARNGEILRTFEGVVEGEIVDPPRGRSGFGYDPVFQPTGLDQTFGEMPAELKNKISHRGRAIAALRAALCEIEN